MKAKLTKPIVLGACAGATVVALFLIPVHESDEALIARHGAVVRLCYNPPAMRKDGEQERWCHEIDSTWAELQRRGYRDRGY